MYIMEPYDNALEEILKHGRVKSNKRTGTKTLAIFGMTRRYRLDTEYFPILTRRKVWPNSIFGELLWFISGSTNNNDLEALGSKIWRPWVDPEFEKKHGYAQGSFGPVYGFNLRHFGGTYGNGIGGGKGTDEKFGWSENQTTGEMFRMNMYGYGFDQLDWMIKRIKEDSSCRRILFSLWDPRVVSQQRLPPCCYSYQICIDDDGLMTGIVTQRSADEYIGVPANIQYYSALTCMIAQQTGYKAYELVHEVHDGHIYENQIPAVEQYLATPIIDSPKLTISKAPSIFEYKMGDFKLADYNPGPVISAPVAV